MKLPADAALVWDGAAPKLARHWRGRARPPARQPSAHRNRFRTVAEDCPWPPERMEVVDALWGEGFQFPGGEAETMRLVKPLGLSAATSLLVLGAGSGGPPCCIASDLGVWVTGYESDQNLLNAATDRSLRAGLSRRAQMRSWDPEAPSFERGYFHHGLALEPLRDGAGGADPAALAQALKPAGTW